LVFPKVFRKPTKTFVKTKIPNKTKENQKTFGKTKKPKFLKVSDPPLDLGLVFLVFWFSRRFFWFSKNLRENQKKTNKTKPISKGGSKGRCSFHSKGFPYIVRGYFYNMVRGFFL